jgi:hypothetical protein
MFHLMTQAPPVWRNNEMKALTIAVAMTALAVAPGMWAQQPDSPQAKAPAEQVQAQENLTGCLASEESTFTLRTSSGMVRLEGVGLEGHVGKTIRVTGNQATAAGKTVFKVSEVEVVSPSCES